MSSPDQPQGGLLPRRIRPQSGVLSSRLGDEIILYNGKTDRMYRLNATGARLWELIVEGHDIDEVQDQLLAEFDVDLQALQTEMSQIIRALTSAELILKSDET